MTGAAGAAVPDDSCGGTRVVLDTNILVAAGFARDSASARIVELVRRGDLRMVWNDATRDEIEHILRKIPPLRRFDRASLFQEADRVTVATDVSRYAMITDPDDREFAALAHAAGATLISNDDHLLAHRDSIDVRVLRPGEFRARRES